MFFGAVPTAEAAGAILAHGLKLPGIALKKGRVLSADDVTRIAAAGETRVIVARLGPGDVAEDEAATRIATAIAGDGLTRAAAFTGRVNLFAAQAGVALIDAARVAAINGAHEAITLATLPAFAAVEPGQMVATIKIIPFAAPEGAVAALEAAGAALRVAPFTPRRVGLIQTRLAGVKDSVLAKTADVMRARVAALGSTLEAEIVAHDEAALATAIGAMQARALTPILVLGASAIVDRRDVIPAAIEALGGMVEHFGMPVDPGNLLLLARLGQTPVIGLPGCARSPKLNGVDWVLQRLLAGVAVTPDDIRAMGVGGLLMETERPQPRAGDAPGPRAPKIAAIVLAAGRSTRMGANKLLQDVGGTVMAARAVDAALASQARPVIVVTGHQADDLRAALKGRDVRFVHNPDFAAGLSTSVRAGAAALPPGLDGALFVLADMPRITSAHLDRLIAAFNPLEGRAICVPTHRAKRGNPVLWAARFMPELGALSGDTGARGLIHAHEDQVAEVEMDDDGVLLDVDTPDALAKVRA